MRKPKSRRKPKWSWLGKPGLDDPALKTAIESMARRQIEKRAKILAIMLMNPPYTPEQLRKCGKKP